MPLVLTDDQLAAIARADPGERTVDLAHRIGALPKVVGSARGRMQAAGRWWCELRLTRCVICNGPILGRAKSRPRRSTRAVRESANTYAYPPVRSPDQVARNA